MSKIINIYESMQFVNCINVLSVGSCLCAAETPWTWLSAPSLSATRVTFVIKLHENAKFWKNWNFQLHSRNLCNVTCCTCDPDHYHVGTSATYNQQSLVSSCFMTFWRDVKTIVNSTFIHIHITTFKNITFGMNEKRIESWNSGWSRLINKIPVQPLR